MTPRKELSEFLVARRGELSREQAGLPPTAERNREAGLSRRDVAVLAGISVYYYARFERGETTGASDAVLESIASALQLDAAQRSHVLGLLRADGTVMARRHHTVAHLVPASVQRILDAITAAPAYARTTTMQVLALNPLGAAGFDALAEQPAAERNLARFVFLQPAARALYADWPAAADMITGRLRQVLAADPPDPAVLKLVEDLEQEPAFAERWRDESSGAMAVETNRAVQLAHPAVGVLRFGTEHLHVEGTDVTITMFLPADTGATQRRLRALALPQRIEPLSPA